MNIKSTQIEVTIIFILFLKKTYILTHKLNINILQIKLKILQIVINPIKITFKKYKKFVFFKLKESVI
jgi:hypothetical protein